jgi:hypothetical protein
MSNRTEQEWIDLGKAGKLWCVEVICRITIEGKKDEVARFRKPNMTWGELMTFRETIFVAGLMMPLGAGTWVIVPPFDISTLYIDKQSKFFPQ